MSKKRKRCNELRTLLGNSVGGVCVSRELQVHRLPQFGKLTTVLANGIWGALSVDVLFYYLVSFFFCPCLATLLYVLKGSFLSISLVLIRRLM